MTMNQETSLHQQENAQQHCQPMMMTPPSISLPLLYFDQKGIPLRVPTSSSATSSSTTTSYMELPAELLFHCLVSYGTLGDMAKYSTIQKSWCRLLDDVTHHISYEMKWYVANSYLYGHNGLCRQPIKAMQLFQELSCSDEHHEYTVPAMKRIAHLYLEGSRGTTSSSSDDNSQGAVGFSSDVDEIDQNTTDGLTWLEKCYTKGNDARSAYDLAIIYEYGKYHVAIDVIMAFDWFHKAAVGGDVDAMAELGLCYELGCGVEQNDQFALDWYMKAAELGHATAKYSIGEAFEEARGVPQSDEEACLWYYKAAIDHDCEDSKKALHRLYDIARIVIPGFTRNISHV